MNRHGYRLVRTGFDQRRGRLVVLYAAHLREAHSCRVRKVGVAVYPSQWERKLVLRDGTRVVTRSIRQGDEPKIHALLQHVSKLDLRLRFFGTIKTFSVEFVASLTRWIMSTPWP